MFIYTFRSYNCTKPLSIAGIFIGLIVLFIGIGTLPVEPSVTFNNKNINNTLDYIQPTITETIIQSNGFYLVKIGLGIFGTSTLYILMNECYINYISEKNAQRQQRRIRPYVISEDTKEFTVKITDTQSSTESQESNIISQDNHIENTYEQPKYSAHEQQSQPVLNSQVVTHELKPPLQTDLEHDEQSYEHSPSLVVESKEPQTFVTYSPGFTTQQISNIQKSWAKGMFAVNKITG